MTADAAAADALDRRGARRRPGDRQGRGRPAAEARGDAMILVYVETSRRRVSGGLARDDHLRPRACPRPAAACRSTRSWSAPLPPTWATELASYGVRNVHHASGDDFDLFSGAATATAVIAARQAAGSVVVMAGGTNRGNEVLARVATRLGVPMAANVVVLPRPLPLRGHPPGRRWRSPGGDASRQASGGVLRRRSRGGACPCRDAGGRLGRAARRSSSRPRTCWSA